MDPPPAAAVAPRAPESAAPGAATAAATSGDFAPHHSHVRSRSASSSGGTGGGGGGGGGTGHHDLRLPSLNVDMAALRRELQAAAANLEAARAVAAERLAAVREHPELLVKQPVAALRNTAVYQQLGRPLETAIARPINRVKDFAQGEIDKVEAKLRARFQGYDDSHSPEKLRAAKLARFRALYDSMDKGRCVCVCVGGGGRRRKNGVGARQVGNGHYAAFPPPLTPLSSCTRRRPFPRSCGAVAAAPSPWTSWRSSSRPRACMRAAPSSASWRTTPTPTATAPWTTTSLPRCWTS
jgi:hypothetical protein